MYLKNKYTSLYFPLRLLLFYLIGLWLWRSLFIWYNDVPDKIYPLIQSVSLDISMICGVIIVGFIPWICFLLTGWSKVVIFIRWLHILLWCFVCIVEFSSLLLFKEWGTTLDVRAVSYLLNPDEAWASVKDFIPFWMIFWALIILVSGIKLLTGMFIHWMPIRQYYMKSIIFIFFIGSSVTLGLRGGWQKLPIVPSDAFYSKDMKNNFAATNKVWYFLYSLSKDTKIDLSNSEAEINAFRQKYRIQPCPTDSISAIWEEKNIVLLVMEGWSADMVAYLGGNENIAPFFDSLSDVSIRYSNAFSTGFRTDQGLMSILSGIPSIHSINMPNVIDKVRKYPSLPDVMKKTGRKTSFMYGGDLNFSNLYNYLSLMGFDTIIRDKDFDAKDRITEWGVPDHVLVEKAVTVLDSNDSIFFSTILFLSSHSPFETPIENQFSTLQDIPSKYKSSVKYSDESLKRFFNMAKTKNWFTNTIFIVTSDHGSTHSGYAKMEDHKRFRIPLIVYSPTSSSISREIKVPCNHFDLPKTLAELTGGNAETFDFGRNIFCNDQNRKAFWNIDIAAGKFGLDTSSISFIGKSGIQQSSDEVLFLDIIKQWFINL